MACSTLYPFTLIYSIHYNLVSICPCRLTEYPLYATIAQGISTYLAMKIIYTAKICIKKFFWEILSKSSRNQRLNPPVRNIPEHSMWFLSVQMKSSDSMVHNSKPLFDTCYCPFSSLSIFYFQSYEPKYPIQIITLTGFLEYSNEMVSLAVVITMMGKDQGFSSSVYYTLS